VEVAGLAGRGCGRAVDVSLCGVLFAADLDLNEKDLVILRLSPDSHTTVECVAQIMRTENRGGDSSRGYYGASIRYLSAADRQRLSFSLLLLREPAANPARL
jgi:hypothetical protein